MQVHLYSISIDTCNPLNEHVRLLHVLCNILCKLGACGNNMQLDNYFLLPIIRCLFERF